jgi:capsular exopolysaccharide synthesis family protein
MNETFNAARSDHAELEYQPDDLAEGGEGIDLRRLWSAVYRSRYYILGVFAAAVVLAILITVLMRPRFTATASVQIDQQAAKVLGSEDTEPAAQVADADRFLQTQVDVLKSRSLELRVVDALGLQRNDDFVRAMGAKVVTPRAGTDPVAAKREQVLTLLENNLKVDLPRNSRVANINFTSPDRVLAARVANSFADNFIIANLQRKYDTSSYARSFLERRLDDTRQKLQDSERAAIDYARSAQLIDATNAASTNTQTGDAQQNGPSSLTVSRLVQVNTAQTDAATASSAALQHWLSSQKVPVLELPEVLSNPAVQELMQQKAQLVAAYQDERQRRKAAYPTMVQEAARIAEMDRQINQLASKIRNSIYDAYKTAKSQEDALKGNFSTLVNQTLAEQDRSIRYNILRREVDTNRTLYDGLLQRYKEVSAEAGITTNNITVVDRADVPLLPTSPKPVLNLALALVLATLASAAVVFAREKLDDVIRTPEDVPGKLELPLLASIPLLQAGDSPLEELEKPQSELAESYQTLRTALELSTSQGVPRTLLVSSSRPSEGKSTTAFAIARSFARLGNRVLLIDGDMRRPSLHRTLGLNNDYGLSSLLAHQRTPDAVAQATAVPNLAFIASGPLPPNPSELLGTEVLHGLLEEFEKHYDLVLIDGPPVLGLADALQLAAAVAGTVFVVEANAGHYGSAKSSVRRLSSVGGHLIGAVLTKFNVKSLGYGYSYAYNYSYKYGS